MCHKQDGLTTPPESHLPGLPTNSRSGRVSQQTSAEQTNHGMPLSETNATFSTAHKLTVPSNREVLRRLLEMAPAHLTPASTKGEALSVVDALESDEKLYIWLRQSDYNSRP